MADLQEAVDGGGVVQVTEYIAAIENKGSSCTPMIAPPQVFSLCLSCGSFCADQRLFHYFSNGDKRLIIGGGLCLFITFQAKPLIS